jgi:LuxR family transcriptional activator of conjugal transfer of Ti plasmids
VFSETSRNRMHRVFQAYIDGLLAASGDIERLRTVLANAGSALDLSVFAYLSMPSRRSDTPELISNYPGRLDRSLSAGTL